MRMCIYSYILLILTSCKTDVNGQELINFERELDKNFLENFYQKLIFQQNEDSKKDIKYFEYFKAFNNSGICFLNNLKDSDSSFLHKKFEKLEKLDINAIVYDEKTYTFKLKKDNTFLQMPEISNDFGLSDINIKDNENCEVFLIESGYSKQIFNNDLKNKYSNLNYTIGIYYFKKENKIIQWLIIYSG